MELLDKFYGFAHQHFHRMSVYFFRLCSNFALLSSKLKIVIWNMDCAHLANCISVVTRFSMIIYWYIRHLLIAYSTLHFTWYSVVLLCAKVIWIIFTPNDVMKVWTFWMLHSHILAFCFSFSVEIPWFFTWNSFFLLETYSLHINIQ